MLFKTQHPLAEGQREAVINSLQVLLYDTVVVTSHAKMAHWNVKGNGFMRLHELFDSIHGILVGGADTLAERIVALGGVAEGSAERSVKVSSIPPYPVNVSEGKQHILEMATRLAAISKSLYAAITSGSLDDVSSNMLQDMVGQVDKYLWFLEAHLQQIAS